MTTAAEFLDDLVLFGKKKPPYVSDLGSLVGPLYIDIDSFRETTGYLMRPSPSEEAKPFWAVDLRSGPSAGRGARVCAHAPVTLGRSPYARLPLQAPAAADAGEIRLLGSGEIELVPQPASASTMWLRGHAISGPAILADGDEIVIINDVVQVRRHPGGSGEQFSEHVTFLAATFHWDVHHQRPNEDRDHSLESVRLHLSIPGPDVVGALEPRFGPPKKLAKGELAMHPFYVTPTAELCSVMWSSEIPERALEKVDGHAREILIRDLLQSLHRMTTLEAMMALVETRRPNAGVFELSVSEGALYADGTVDHELRIHFRPPVDARELCAIAGWKNANAESHDVHMSSWRIFIDDRHPRIGGWIVEASLNGWPRRADGTDHDAAHSYDLDRHTGQVEWLCVRAPRSHDR